MVFSFERIKWKNTQIFSWTGTGNGRWCFAFEKIKRKNTGNDRLCFAFEKIKRTNTGNDRLYFFMRKFHEKILGFLVGLVLGIAVGVLLLRKLNEKILRFLVGLLLGMTVGVFF